MNGNSANITLQSVNFSSVGIDVHMNKIVACHVLSSFDEYGREVQDISFLTTTSSGPDRQKMVDWIAPRNPDAIVIESTGIYWVSIFRDLEAAGLKPDLINPRRHHNDAPGRKTDANDAQWLAELARLGHYRASFIPEEPYRTLRLLVTQHRKTVNEYSAAKNRLLKILDHCGFRLSSVFSDPHSCSARAVLDLILDNKLTVENIEECINENCKHSAEEIFDACQGHLNASVRGLIGIARKIIEDREEELRLIETALKNGLSDNTAEIKLLQTIPGIQQESAEYLVATLGTNIEKSFPSRDQFTRWCGVCPGNKESAGKRLSGRTPPSLVNIKTTLVECAQGAARTKNTEFYRTFCKKKHKGYKSAIMCVAHKLARVIYAVLTTGTVYMDRFYDYKTVNAKTATRCIKQLIKLYKEDPKLIPQEYLPVMQDILQRSQN